MNIPKVSAIPAVTRAQMIMVDRLMIEKYGINLLQMMENGGQKPGGPGSALVGW